MIRHTNVLIASLDVVYGSLDVIQINDLFFAFKITKHTSLLVITKTDCSNPDYCNVIVISDSMPTYNKLSVKTISMRLTNLIIKRIKKEKILFKGI